MYTGTIEEFNGQAIKTKFFILGIPLFPISSFYFVKKNQGIELPLISKSARLGFGRTLCLAVGLLLVILCQLNDHWPNHSIKILSIAGAFIFMAIAIYSWSKQQNIPPSEKRIRIILEKTIGYNMLPTKLPLEIRRKLLKQVVAPKVATKYPDVDLITILSKGNYEESEMPLIYCLALYADSINPNQLYKDIFTRYPVDTINFK